MPFVLHDTHSWRAQYNYVISHGKRFIRRHGGRARKALV